MPLNLYASSYFREWRSLSVLLAHLTVNTPDVFLSYTRQWEVHRCLVHTIEAEVDLVQNQYGHLSTQPDMAFLSREIV